MPNDAEEDDDFVCKDCDKLSTFPTGCKIPVPTCRGGATPDIDICILIYWCIDLLIYWFILIFMSINIAGIL
jgi:hypothetical protein